MGAAAVWIEAVGMVACHITGLPDIDEIGEATHFCNKEMFLYFFFIKFVFSEKATKIDEIFTVDLTLTT